MKVFFLFALVFFTVASFAHDDDEIPGALPPPPHGGRLEAAEPEGHHHGQDLYIEATLEGKKLNLYPLTLTPAPNQDFRSAASPNEISGLVVKVQRGKSRQSSPLAVKLDGDHYVGSFDPQGAHRVTVLISVIHEKLKKTAQLKIETSSGG